MTDSDGREIKGSTKHCPSCGATLVFFPQTQNLHCDSCGGDFPFLKSNAYPRHTYTGREDIDGRHEEWRREVKVFSCENCGAKVELYGLDVTKVCPYCGGNYVADLTEFPSIRPDAVLPFAFDKREAKRRFVYQLKKNFLAPRKLKKHFPDSCVHPFYFPAFSFDMVTNSVYRGEIMKTRVIRRGKTTVTEHYPVRISGSKRVDFFDLTVESSSRITGEDLKGISPFNTNESYAFSPDFIRGYSLEHYDEPISNRHAMAVAEARSVIEREILKDYTYSSVNYLNVKADAANEKYVYRILPAYHFGFKYGNKEYSLFMNGYSGKLGKGLPKSKLKIALLSVLGLAVVVGLLWLAVQFFM